MTNRNDNFFKMEHGAAGINSLQQLVDLLIERGYIVKAVRNYRIAAPTFKDKQFSAQFLIEFSDTEQWVLHHTTSIRDRINIQQWNSFHIKRINPNVQKSYVVVPDNLKAKEQKTAEAYHNKIIQGTIYSAIDDVVPFEYIYHLIEQKAISLMPTGRALAKRGLHFEKILADSLNNAQNLEKWKNKSPLEVGFMYSLFLSVMNELRINSAEVERIEATTDIPKLPSGGLPKTDVLLRVFCGNGEKEYTFSCKRSSANYVTVHEYTAGAFSKVLNPEDEQLKQLLMEFQTVGGVQAMTAEDANALETRLSLYKEKLSKWVYAGIGGEGDPKTQWVSHMITFNEKNHEYSIRSVDEYLKACMDQEEQGQLGTMFKWTYPSGKKGKRIQLKGKMI